MSSSRESGGVDRWLPLSGLVFVVIVVVTFVAVAGNTPESDSSAAKVVSFYQDHQNSQIVSAFLLAAAAPFLVFFGINLSLALWPSGAGRRPVWPAVLAIGSAIGAMSFIVAAHGVFAVADGVDHLSPEALQGLNVLDSDSWIVFNSGLGIMMLGAAGCLIPRGGSARYLGWSALVLGVALFIPFADFVALLLTGIWIIVTSIMQFRDSPALAPSTA
jgi:hypothetical protein